MSRRDEIVTQIARLQRELDLINATPEDTFLPNTTLVIVIDNLPRAILIKQTANRWLVFRQTDTVADYTEYLFKADAVVKYVQDETVV